MAESVIAGNAFPSIQGVGGYNSAETTAVIQSYYNAMPNSTSAIVGLRAGDYGTLIVTKADDNYGSLFHIGYSVYGDHYRVRMKSLYGGTWGPWREFVTVN